MQTSPDVYRLFRRAARCIQSRHQGKDTDPEKHRRRKRSQEPQARPGPERQINRHNRPRGESGSLVEVSDGAMVEREPALDHSRRLKTKGGEQEQIVDLVVLAKSFSPK